MLECVNLAPVFEIQFHWHISTCIQLLQKEMSALISTTNANLWAAFQPAIIFIWLKI